MSDNQTVLSCTPWNKGKLVGAKPPLRQRRWQGALSRPTAPGITSKSQVDALRFAGDRRGGKACLEAELPQTSKERPRPRRSGPGHCLVH